MTNNAWDASFYNQQHNFVTTYGESLIPLLDPKPNEIILDLGCGTGPLTAQLAKMAQRVIGIDSSSDMLALAKRNYPDIEFLVADGQNFKLGQTVDAVFSNAAMHWMLEPAKVANCVWEALKPGGRFVFEMGGKGNIKTIEKACDYAFSRLGIQPPLPINYFPSIGEYSHILEKQGFIVKYAVCYDRPTELSGEDGLVNWLKMFRNHMLNQIPHDKQESFFSFVEEYAKPRLRNENNNWIADYVRLSMVAIKPGNL